jgi:hypothetical protein
MEKVFGPFSGYLVVVCVIEASDAKGYLSTSYRIQPQAPAGDSKSNPTIQRRVAGLFRSVEEALDIALQLARLQLAGLPSRVAGTAEPEKKSTTTLAEFAKSWGEDAEYDFTPAGYQATMPCPLQPLR